MVAEEPHDACVKFAVERCPVEPCGHIRANSRYCGRKLRRARRQKSKVAARHDMNLGRPGKAAGDAVRALRIDSGGFQLRSPELQRNLDGGWLSRVKNWLGGSAIAAALMRPSCGGRGGCCCEVAHKILSIILTSAHEIRRDSDQCQACIAAHGETEQTDPALIDDGFVFPVLQQEIEKATISADGSQRWTGRHRRSQGDSY